MKTCNDPLSPREQVVCDALMQVIDPEAGENIVDLGLVYGIEAEGNAVKVLLTMTSAACPMADMLLDDINTTLTKLLCSDVHIEVNLVWEPPWGPDMISAAAKQRLGWA